MTGNEAHSGHSLCQRSFRSPEPGVLPSWCSDGHESPFDPQEDVGTPKDKRTPQVNAGVVCQVLCEDCPCVYTSETERSNRVRENEQWDVRSLKEVNFTQARKKDSVSEVQPSAITDHVAKNSCTID